MAAAAGEEGKEHTLGLDEEVQVKKRRTLPKLDQWLVESITLTGLKLCNSLLSARGISTLRRMGPKKFKARGKSYLVLNPN